MRTSLADGASISGVLQGPATGRRPRRGDGWIAAPPVAWLAVFFVAPLLVMLLASFWQRREGRLDTTLTLDNYRAFFDKPYLSAALVNALEITALTVLVALPLAYAFAAVLAFVVPPRLRLVALALAVVPFWTSYIVRSYSWLLVLSERGIVNNALLELGLIAQPLQMVNGRVGTVLVFVHYFTIIMTVTIFVSLRSIPKNYINAAYDLGASPWQVFVRVLLPLSMGGVMSGVFLTVVISLGDYVTPQIIGGNNELVLSQAIMLQLGRLANAPMAAALSVVLMAVIASVYLLAARWLTTARR